MGDFVSSSKSAVLSRFQNRRFCLVFKIGCFVSFKIGGFVLPPPRHQNFSSCFSHFFSKTRIAKIFVIPQLPFDYPPPYRLTLHTFWLEVITLEFGFTPTSAKWLDFFSLKIKQSNSGQLSVSQCVQKCCVNSGGSWRIAFNFHWNPFSGYEYFAWRKCRVVEDELVCTHFEMCFRRMRKITWKRKWWAKKLYSL